MGSGFWARFDDCDAAHNGRIPAPEGFSQPSVVAVLREGSVLTEAGRYAVSAFGSRGARRRTPLGARPMRVGEPVLLVPGFLAGDSRWGR